MEFVISFSDWTYSIRAVKMDEHSLKEHLECVICTEITRNIEIYICCNGHNICENCYSKLGRPPVSCPQGRCTFTHPPIRVRALEQLLLVAPFSQSPVHCLCGNSNRDSFMLECRHCGRSQHGACYRVLQSPSFFKRVLGGLSSFKSTADYGVEHPGSQHCCWECSREEGKTCTDSKMGKIVLKAADNTELLRNTLLYRRVLVTLMSHRQKVTQLFLRQSLGIGAELADLCLGVLIKREVVNSEHMVNFTELELEWSTAVLNFSLKSLGMKKANGGRNGKAWVMSATTFMVVVISVLVIILDSA